MTFVGRFNHFKCNDCGEGAEVSTFPEGWVTIRKMNEVTHHCRTCAEKLPKGTKVWSQGAKEHEYHIVK